MAKKGTNIDLATLVIPATVQAASHQAIYANATRLGVSPWDIRLVFGQVMERDGKPLNEDAITVIMAPAQAKAFLNALTTTIQKFEEAFGEINDPSPRILAARAARTAIEAAQAKKTPARRITVKKEKKTSQPSSTWRKRPS